MPAHPRAIFLSYASQDADVAKKVADALQAAGMVVWLDQSDLRGGEAWDAYIQRQISTCTLFVAIISARTQGRREGYFRLEWRLAEERMRRMALGTPFLLPVAVDDISERDALVPRSFLEVQWVRLPNGEVTSALVRLAQQMLVSGTLRGETLLYVPPETAPAVARPPTTAPLPADQGEPRAIPLHAPPGLALVPGRWRRMFAAVGVLAMTALGAWLLWRT